MEKSWINKIKKLFKKKMAFESSLWEDIENILLESDINFELSQEIIQSLKNSQKNLSEQEVLKEELKKILLPYIKSSPLPYEKDKMNLYFILGVNGVGKTTTLAKLAYFFKKDNISNLLFCAGDTFRAAASLQLIKHAESMDIRCIAQKEGSDPASVLWDALMSAKSHKNKIVLIDTSGRLHNKTHLIEELKKMASISHKCLSDIPFAQHNILILDANSGQNSIIQADIFKKNLPLSGIILSKFDGSSKSGSLLNVFSQLNLPILGIGKGEQKEDFISFDEKVFLDKFLTF